MFGLSRIGFAVITPGPVTAWFRSHVAACRLARQAIICRQRRFAVLVEALTGKTVDPPTGGACTRAFAPYTCAAVTCDAESAAVPARRRVAQQWHGYCFRNTPKSRNP